MAKSSSSKATSGKRSQQQREAEVARETKKQIALKRRQTRQNRYIYIGLVVVAGLIALVLGIALVQELVVRPATPVGRVNGVKISQDDYQDLLRLQRYTTHVNMRNLQDQLQAIDTSNETNQFLVSIYQQQLDLAQNNLALLPDTTLDLLIEDILITEKAGEAGLTVTDEEIAARLNEDLSAAASASQPTTPITGTQEIGTPTPVPQEDLDALLQSALDNMGLNRSQYEEIVRREMLRDEVQDLLASEVISTGLVVHVQLIKTPTEEEAAGAQARIEAGEEFSVVASEVSTDTLSLDDGGDLGWVTTGQLASRYGQELEDAVMAAGTGDLSIVQSGEDYYLFLVAERDENGPLPPEILSQRQASALTDWLAERKASPDVEIERLLQLEQIPDDPFEYLTAGR